MSLYFTIMMTKDSPGIERVQALADVSRSALCCHSNETRAPIANPPNSARLEGTPTIPQVTFRVHAVVWECGDRQTDTQTAETTIHFASATPHSKCIEQRQPLCYGTEFPKLDIKRLTNILSIKVSPILQFSQRSQLAR